MNQSFTPSEGASIESLPVCTVGCEAEDGTPFVCGTRSFQPPAHAQTAGAGSTEHMSESASDAAMTVESRKKTAFERLAGKVIEVEGNIGCGKSTLTRHLSELSAKETKDSNFSVVHGEKVNNEFLAVFYNNPVQYAFAFQMYMLTTRIYQMDEAYRQAKQENKFVLLDRGAVGDVLFALQNFKSNNISELEMKVYKSVCTERFPESLSDKVDCVLYLDVAPETCFYRMTTLRQRPAEEGVPVAYLDGIDEVYFHLFIDWLGSRKGGFYDMNIGRAPPVCVIRWNKFGCTRDVLEEIADTVDGIRKSPVVEFTEKEATELNAEEYGRIFTTEAQLEEAYRELEEKDEITGCDTSILVDWSLPHKAAFRRVVMYTLSKCGKATFCGKSTLIQTPRYNCAEREPKEQSTTEDKQ